MLSWLIGRFKGILVVAVLASVVSGVGSVLVVTRIHAALTSTAVAPRALAAAFAASAVAMLLAGLLSSILFEQLRQRANAELRRYISLRVNDSPLRHLEQVGAASVQAALSEHTANVSQFFVTVPVLLTNGVIVLGCLIYLALLSAHVFLAALLLIGLGSLGYHVAHLRAIRYIRAGSQELDRLFGHFRALIDGAKELRLNYRKRRGFGANVLGESIETVRRQRTTGMMIFIAASSWGNLLIYAFIGLVLFLLAGDGPDRARIMTGFALILIYLVSPLQSLLLWIPSANLARVSSERIEEVTRHLSVVEPDVAQATGVATGAPEQADTLRQLVLAGVQHRYYHEKSGETFQLGPIDLTFHPGELVFLVGGNGSGKTTLAKLLVGLYSPEEGQIRLNGHPVEEAGRDRYRQYFSAVFADFHLFDRLLEARGDELDARCNRLIRRFQLQHRVQVANGMFSTRELSQGQRKRLALIVACLEDRPLLVFDEWAADQDPLFKEVFYREVLPELRALGKCVIAITHDDRYFHLANRLIRLEDGQVVQTGAADERSLETA